MDIILFFIGVGLLFIFLIYISWSPGSGAGRNYGELLQRSEWKRKREKILRRDKYRCVWCGSKVNLQVHHKCYWRYPDGRMALPWDYPDGDLITLCGKCHRRWHGKHRSKVYYRRWGVHYPL